jgi:DNA-binding transcriptional MerR regulator
MSADQRLPPAQERLGSRPIYAIGAVARMLNVPVGTIRSWQDRYGILEPARTAGGQRLYSRDQLEQLRFITARIAEGSSPAEAHRLLEELRERGSGAVPEDAVASRRLLILLAEQDPFGAEFSEYFLRTEGYDVRISFDAGEAERLHAEMAPDLTIVALMISGGIGVDLCRRMRERSDRPILAISSLDIPDTATDAGADAFLYKPFGPLELVATVKDLLGESALLRGKVDG